MTVTRLAAPGAGDAKMELRQPLLIYSRSELNRMLLARAERAGAQIEQARVLGLARRNGGWRLATKHGSFDADFCVIATGAKNGLRGVGTLLTPADTMLALGYYVPAEQDHIDIQFLPRLEGYIWVFPRCGHLSVGICGKGEPARMLRARLEPYMEEKGISWKDGTFYSHVLPSLATPAWRQNRVAGDGWLAVGDAGGLVDPITGEGLYYAIRSADLASQVMLSDAHAPEDKPRRTARSWSATSPTTWTSVRAGPAPFPRPVPVCQRAGANGAVHAPESPFRDLVQDLFAGTQAYSASSRGSCAI